VTKDKLTLERMCVGAIRHVRCTRPPPTAHLLPRTVTTKERNLLEWCLVDGCCVRWEWMSLVIEGCVERNFWCGVKLWETERLEARIEDL